MPRTYLASKAHERAWPVSRLSLSHWQPGRIQESMKWFAVRRVRSWYATENTRDREQARLFGLKGTRCRDEKIGSDGSVNNRLQVPTLSR